MRIASCCYRAVKVSVPRPSSIRPSLSVASAHRKLSKVERTWPTQHYRQFSATGVSRHGQLGTPAAGEECVYPQCIKFVANSRRRSVTFIDKEGQEHPIQVADGDNLLDIAQANDIEMEGACGGSCACSTCHVIVEDESFYDRMPEPTDEENDMLDLAFGLTETSRLGCQVKMSKELHGLRVKLPSMTRNLQASDFEKR